MLKSDDVKAERMLLMMATEISVVLLLNIIHTYFVDVDVSVLYIPSYKKCVSGSLKNL